MKRKKENYYQKVLQNFLTKCLSLSDTNRVKKRFQGVKNHLIAVIACIVIAVLSIVASSYANPGTTTIGEDISTTNLTVSGNATTTGNLNVGGTFSVTGTSTIPTISGIVNFLNGLTITGNATTTGNQAITGDLTMGAVKAPASGYILHKDNDGNIITVELFSDSTITDYGDESVEGSIEWAVNQLPQPTWKTITGIAKQTADSGTTDGVTAYKLIQSGQNFTSTVVAGMVVRNTTDSTNTTVEAVDSDTQLSLGTDIMASGEVYVIEHMQVTSASHGFTNGDTVYIRRSERTAAAASGMTQVNNVEYTVFNSAANTFSLKWINGNGWTAYTAGGQARKVNGVVVGGTVILNCGGYPVRTINIITEDYIKIIGKGRDCTHVYADPTLKCTGRTSCPAGGSFEGFNITGDYVTLENFEFNGSINAISYQIVSHAVVIGGGGGNTNKCKYWNYGTGIHHMKIHSSRADGVVIGPCSDNANVSDNILYNHNNPDEYVDGTSSLELEDGAKNSIFSRNYVYASDRCLFPHIHSGYDSMTGILFSENTCVYKDLDGVGFVSIANADASATLELIVQNNNFVGTRLQVDNTSTGSIRASIINNTFSNTETDRVMSSALQVGLPNQANIFATVLNNTFNTTKFTSVLVLADNGFYLGNKIYNPQDNGFRIDTGATGNVITDNFISGAGQDGFGYGMDVYDDNNIIRNNNIVGTTGNALRVRSTADSVIVRDNTFSGSSSYNVWADSANTIYINNTGTERTYTADGTTFAEYFGTINLNGATATLTYSLPNGTSVIGEPVLIKAVTSVANNPVVTIPAWDLDTNNDNNDTCTFDTVGDYILLRWDSAKWVTINYTCTATVD